VAAARLSPDRAKDAVADAIFDRNPNLRNAAFAAAQVIASQRVPRVKDPFAVPDGPLSVRTLLDEMIPSGFTPKERLAALVAIEQPLTRAALDAVRTSPERAMLIADALLARSDAPALAPFTDDIESVPQADREQAEQAVRRIAQALAPAFIALVRHPSIDLRVRAIRVLARETDSQSTLAVVDGLSDENETVQRATLTALADMHTDASTRALSTLLAHNENWALRVRAAQALGNTPPMGSANEAQVALTNAARHDSFALVRQRAVESLFRISPQNARATLEIVAKEDPEPRVKETARRLLGN
jgi:HEAT repeat protein